METQTKNRAWWKTPWLWAGLLFVVAAAVVVAAGLPALSAESAAAPETETAVAVEPAAKTLAAVTQPETEVRSDTAELQEEATEVVADVPSSDNCIACHTDEALLKEIAEEPEAVHSEEAEGEG